MERDDLQDLEFINRLLELYTIEDILELNDLEVSEALHLLELQGAIDFDNIPS